MFFNAAQKRIAQTQADVAIEKLKVDLFDKRYSIYLSAKQLIEHLAAQTELEKVDHGKVRSLFVTLDEGRFFLPEGVRKFLDELHQTSNRLLKVLGERSNLSLDDQEAWSSTADKASALTVKLLEICSAYRTFEEALAFKEIDPIAAAPKKPGRKKPA